MASQHFSLRTSSRTWDQVSKAGMVDVSAASDFAGSTTAHWPTSATMPTGDGYIQIVGDNLAKMIVWCEDSSAGGVGDKIDTVLASYSQSLDEAGIWIPTHIATLRWEFGALTGVALRTPSSSHNFAKNVELIDGDTSIRLITDTGASGIASVTVDLEGASVLAVGYDVTSVTQPDTGVNTGIALF